MRIVSLVPSATEALFALGLGPSVVGVTHECDYPSEAAALPNLTRSVLPDGLGAAEIDAAVRERTSRGEAIYELDEDVLSELEPDLVVTQAVCEVCAVSLDDVRAVAERLESKPRLVSLDPSTIGEVLADMRRLAEAAGQPRAADALLSDAAARIDRVRSLTESLEHPRVVALEWLDPPYVGGHWVPQMIELAGGDDALGFPGEKSRVADWEELRSAQPEVVVSMPCGYDAAVAARETALYRDRLEALDARVVAVDAAAYFSRPGPRLIDGIELLAYALHPANVEPPPPGRIVEEPWESTAPSSR